MRSISIFVFYMQANLICLHIFSLNLSLHAQIVQHGEIAIHALKMVSSNCPFSGLILGFCTFVIKLSVKSPSLSPPIPSFEWYPRSKEIFIKSQYEMLK